VEVRVHATWLAILAFVIVAVAVQPNAFPAGFPSSAGPRRHALGFLFFVSIVVHELAHALAAGSRGLPAGPVLIVVFGGLTSVDDDSVTPTDEFVIAVSGPVVSIAVGVPLLGAGLVIGEFEGGVLERVNEAGVGAGEGAQLGKQPCVPGEVGAPPCSIWR
jgi:Zn-dependent protease